MKLATAPEIDDDAAEHRSRARLYPPIKRAGDLVLAIVLLPILVPVIAILWCLVRRDGAPGFYAQLRVGQNGRRFRCWKLRTMHPDAEERLRALCASDPAVAREWEVMQKLSDDPRITPTGAFLRATSLDELPQIFNVLTGDMSFVGPRPFMECQEEIYRSAGGRSYYAVRPGITGPWQVAGRNKTSFADRVAFDEAYCRSLSPVTDARLILHTAAAVLRREGC